MAVLDFLSTPARQAATLDQTAHRPWPVNERPWMQGQTWENLLLAHWRVDEAQLRSLVPAQIPLDTFDGSAWLGITPFRLSGLRLRGLPSVPLLSTFLELNVRTYVKVDDKPGIWFFSLDCASAWAVGAARLTYHLPYYRARMSAQLRDGWIEYRSERRDGSARFRGRYRARGEASPATPGSIDYFLTERYCLYTLDERVGLRRADIHHPPWPLQAGEAEIDENTMPPDGVALPDEAPLLHFSARQDVVIWPLEPARP